MTPTLEDYKHNELPKQLQEVDRLSAIVDPEQTPYVSKYQARTILVCLMHIIPILPQTDENQRTSHRYVWACRQSTGKLNFTK